MPRPNKPNTTREPEEKIRTCSTCGREIFNLPDEGISGDENLCTDCWDGGLDQEFVA